MDTKRSIETRNKGENLVKYVYDYIMQMLLRQELKCGEKVPEEKIASLLNVSRTPIREALRILAAQGLVNIYPKRFAEVVTFSREDIHEMGVIRLNHDILAAKLAIYNGSNADFMELEAISKKCVAYSAEGDIYNRIISDAEFHTKLSQIAGNALLTKFQIELYQRICLLQATEYRNIPDSIQKIAHHEQIIEGLVKRDETLVIAATTEHLIQFYDLRNSKYKYFLEQSGI